MQIQPNPNATRAITLVNSGQAATIYAPFYRDTSQGGGTVGLKTVLLTPKECRHGFLDNHPSSLLSPVCYFFSFYHPSSFLGVMSQVRYTKSSHHGSIRTLNQQNFRFIAVAYSLTSLRKITKEVAKGTSHLTSVFDLKFQSSEDKWSRQKVLAALSLVQTDMHI